MKNVLRSIFWVIASFSFLSVVNAKNRVPELTEQSVYAKCFVELVGGGETLGFWLIKPSELKMLTRNIVGKEILLVMDAQKSGSNSKAVIYNTKECALEGDEFNSSRARIFDKAYER